MKQLLICLIAAFTIISCGKEEKQSPYSQTTVKETVTDIKLPIDPSELNEKAEGDTFWIAAEDMLDWEEYQNIVQKVDEDAYSSQQEIEVALEGVLSTKVASNAASALWQAMTLATYCAGWTAPWYYSSAYCD